MTIRLTLPKKPEKVAAPVATPVAAAGNPKDACTDHRKLPIQTAPKHKSAAAAAVPRPKPKPQTAIEVGDPGDGAYAPPKRSQKLSESSIESFTLDAEGNKVVKDIPVVRALL